MSADHTVSRFVSEKTYQKRKMVSKLNKFFGIMDIVIFADGLIVLDGTVLDKSDYESGSSLPRKLRPYSERRYLRFYLQHKNVANKDIELAPFEFVPIVGSVVSSK